MRLALEVFGLELALTFGPVTDEELEEEPGQLQHVEGSFDPAPAAGDPALGSRGFEYEDTAGFGFGAR